MANIYRLIISLFFAFIVALPDRVFAFPQSMQYFISAFDGSGQLGPFGSPGGACGPWYNSFTGKNLPHGKDMGYLPSPGVYGTCTAGDGTNWFFGSPVGGRMSCPANSTDNAGDCSCNSGYEEKSSTCEPVLSPLDKWCKDFEGAPWNGMETERKYSDTPSSFQSCARSPFWDPEDFPGKGCLYNVQKEWGAQSRTDGKYYTYGNGVGAGVPCDIGPGADPEKKEAKNPECESGQPGVVNGVKVCVPYLPETIERKQTENKNTKTTCSGGTCTTTTTTKTSSSEKPVFDSSSPNQGGSDGTGSGVPRTYGWKEGGSGEGGGKDIPAPGSIADGWDRDKPVETQRETTKEQTKNADGSLSPVKVTERTTSSQVGADGKVTTATETRSWYEDSSGNRVGDINNESGEVKREDKRTFCEENPKLTICRDSAFSGACGVDFKCDGDAIQCAIVREQHNRNCKLFDLKSLESELYEKEKNKEGDQTKELPGNETIDMNNRIKTDDLLGGGGGIMDVNITVWNRSITLPFSQLNSTLQYLGNILVAIAMLSAVRIIGGK
ncbi:hypothetical protein [Comamonas granuli]|uniref:hypothetical protein n=1 Tax=Comamonas granuli TaxID=290309 RepID=UPI0012EC622C|nr:hypothetical protein [Comamonas granuli]